MLRFWRRHQASRRHPTPVQAAEALLEKRCLYEPVSTCAGPPRKESLRVDGADDILVCKAHYGRLRRMPERELEKLERKLRSVFGVGVAA